MGTTGAPPQFFGETERYRVLLQGRIYNKDEFGAADDSDAQALAELVTRAGLDAALGAVNGDVGIVCCDKTIAPHVVGRRKRQDRCPAVCYAVTPDGVANSVADGVASKARRRVAQGQQGICRPVRGLALPHIRHAPDESPSRTSASLPAAHVAEILRWKVSRISAATGGSTMRRCSRNPRPSSRSPIVICCSTPLGGAFASRQAGFHVVGWNGFVVSVLACARQDSGQKAAGLFDGLQRSDLDESSEIRSMLDTNVESWNQVRIHVRTCSARWPGWWRARRAGRDRDLAVAFPSANKAVEAGVRSLFGGLGGNELNAGEYEYFMLFFADLSRRNGRICSRPRSTAGFECSRSSNSPEVAGVGRQAARADWST